MSNSTFGGSGNPDLIDLVSEDEDGPSSGNSSSKGLEAFLDSALENDPVLRGILEEGLTQIVKAAIRLLNLQRRRNKGQAQGHSRENKEERHLFNPKVENVMNCGDLEGPGENRLVEKGQGSGPKGADNNPPIETPGETVGRKEALGASPHSHSSDHVAATGTERQPEQGPPLPGPAGKPRFNKGPKRSSAQGQRQRKMGPSKHCCYFCQKTFPTLFKLEAHLSTHTREKPFPCTLCGKEFSLKGNLDVHLRVHRKEKRFTCNFCGKGLSTKQALETHIRFHVKEKAYKCNLCGKDFVVKSNLEEHIRRHVKEKWFKCPHPGCSSSFVTGSDLKTHSTAHSGEKLFPCPYPNCGKHFAWKNVRDGHHRLHTGEKPFACGCGKTYATSSSLSKHRKNCDEGNRVIKKRKIEEHFSIVN